jgi:nucleoid-associated protein YgaU
MNTKLNCPVCGYKEVEGKTCPNCETDLSLIRTLQDLAPLDKPLEKKAIQPKISNWTLALALLILIIGICLGAISSFVLIKNQYSNELSANSTVVVNSATITSTPVETNFYTVKRGDNLGLIAEKVCGRASAWRLIADANPNLENRPNYFLNVGEKLKIPNCQEKNP